MEKFKLLRIFPVILRIEDIFSISAKGRTEFESCLTGTLWKLSAGWSHPQRVVVSLKILSLKFDPSASTKSLLTNFSTLLKFSQIYLP